MKRVLLFCLFAALSTSCAHQGSRQIASEEASVSYDWNKDGTPDVAFFSTETEGEYGWVTILLSQPNGELVEVAKNVRLISNGGGMAGTESTIALNPQGSILITNQNESVGRNRWSATFTVAYRKGKFVLAGYTYAERDTIDHNNGGNCDLNLLAGRGTRNGKPIKVTPRVIPFAAISDDFQPKQCRF